MDMATQHPWVHLDTTMAQMPKLCSGILIGHTEWWQPSKFFLPQGDFHGKFHAKNFPRWTCRPDVWNTARGQMQGLTLEEPPSASDSPRTEVTPPVSVQPLAKNSFSISKWLCNYLHNILQFASRTTKPEIFTSCPSPTHMVIGHSQLEQMLTLVKH